MIRCPDLGYKTVITDVNTGHLRNVFSRCLFYVSQTDDRLPLEGIGRHAAEILINMLGGVETGSHEPIKFPCNMMIRDSVSRLAY